jgi:hypothetical protein
MDFPRTVEKITLEWLTKVLRDKGHIETSTVRDLSVEQLSGGYTGSVIQTQKKCLAEHWQTDEAKRRSLRNSASSI